MSLTRERFAQIRDIASDGGFSSITTHEALTDVLTHLGMMAPLLLEARDALPAITAVSARLHGVNLSLADRIEGALAPWLVDEEAAP